MALEIVLNRRGGVPIRDQLVTQLDGRQLARAADHFARAGHAGVGFAGQARSRRAFDRSRESAPLQRRRDGYANLKCLNALHFRLNSGKRPCQAA